MSDLVKIDNGDLIEYLIKTGKEIDLPKPFERDIYLFDTYVAGTSHIEGIENIGGSLKDGDRLVFYREPENEHDPQAIRIENLEGKKLATSLAKIMWYFQDLWMQEKFFLPRLLKKKWRASGLK